MLLLNYKDTPKGAPETKWSDANKEAFLKAVREGKGLVVFHFASSAFTKPNWEEFEKAIAGGWRTQGFHGPKHDFTVKKTAVKHPISEGLPAEFDHTIDELYQNSVMVPGNEVLATAYSDPAKPRGTGKDEPVIWVNTYGKGRVYNNALGHDVEAMSDPNFQAWIRRGVIWAATGHVDPQARLEARPNRLLSRSEYLDKMKAGWIGQMAGVAIGGPTEFRYQGQIVPADKVPGWKPEMINQFDQDDLYVEMTFLRTLEQHGLGASARQAGIDFANSRYPLWHANKAGRELLRKGIAPPDSGHPALNAHADDIDYQIEADFSGLIAPGLPNTVIALGETFGRLMNAATASTAASSWAPCTPRPSSRTTWRRSSSAGLAAIPKDCQYHECISDVLAWHKREPQGLGEDLDADRREVPEEPRLPPVLVQQEREGPVQVQHRCQAQRCLHRDGTALRRGRPGPHHRDRHPVRPGLRLQPRQRGRHPVHDHRLLEAGRQVDLRPRLHHEVQLHPLQLPEADRRVRTARRPGRPPGRRADRQERRRPRDLRHPGRAAPAQLGGVVLESRPAGGQQVQPGGDEADRGEGRVRPATPAHDSELHGHPPGQRDYSSVRISRHALERFVERFGAEPESAAELLRKVLARPAGWAAIRRTGRSPCWPSTASGPGGDPPGQRLPDRADLEPVRPPARRVRPHPDAAQVGPAARPAGPAAGSRAGRDALACTRERPFAMREGKGKRVNLGQSCNCPASGSESGH